MYQIKEVTREKNSMDNIGFSTVINPYIFLSSNQLQNLQLQSVLLVSLLVQ